VTAPPAHASNAKSHLRGRRYCSLIVGLNTKLKTRGGSNLTGPLVGDSPSRRQMVDEPTFQFDSKRVAEPKAYGETCYRERYPPQSQATNARSRFVF
jgi:hypothetical protein